MAALTTTRRVLSDLNINTPNSRNTTTPHKIDGEAGDMAQQGGFASISKRGSLFDENMQSSPKRRRTEPQQEGEGQSTTAKIGGSVAAPKLGLLPVSSVPQHQALLSPGRQVRVFSVSSTPSASPSSSFGNSTNEVNDSQHTILTEPDFSFFPEALPASVPTPSTTLSPEALREKARAMKLRLGLASYKVRTNQIDVPLARLEIRSSQSSQKLPSFNRSFSNASFSSQPRTALSNFTSAPNDSSMQYSNSTAETPQAPQFNIPSSPPLSYGKRSDLPSPRKETEGVGRDSFATPILPRQRDGLLNPPQLGSPTSLGNDLTSSVVKKGRAADGLLSLMRQQE